VLHVAATRDDSRHWCSEIAPMNDLVLFADHVKAFLNGG
jgi:hypothetical protein